MTTVSRPALLFLMLIMIIPSSCIPTRHGKVKRIITDELQRGDSILLYRSFMMWEGDGLLYEQAGWMSERKAEQSFESQWDSSFRQVAGNYFRVRHVEYNRTERDYKFRPFQFRVLLGRTETVRSDSLSWLISNALWTIRAGDVPNGLSFIPDSLLKQSYVQPVGLMTTSFRYYDYPTAVQYFDDLSRGHRLEPNSVFLVLKNGKIVFMNNFRKSYDIYNLLFKNEVMVRSQRKLFKGLHE